MKIPSLTSQSSAYRIGKRGFALVATVLLMVLLALLAVGTLSLSSVTLRSASMSSAQEVARANARMALMIAIGRLQSELGPDQRISANGAILDEDVSKVKHPHWTGVWNSWKAGTGEPSQHSTITPPSSPAAGVMSPTYETGRNDYFRSWLVSLADTDATNWRTPLDLDLTGEWMPVSSSEAVRLVGEGSLGKDAASRDYVSVGLIDVKDSETTTGRYGWWVGDESQKARIMADSYVGGSTLTAAQKIFRQQAPGSMGNTAISGLEDVTDDTQFTALPSLKTLDLVSDITGRPSQSNFHDATLFSYNVLADVREGGLKRDLSTLLERAVNPAERGDEFMLYKFGIKDAWANTGSLPSTPQEAVPIQDLAAYYQLYDKSRKGGVDYTGGIKVISPNYGTKTSYTLNNDYTGMYRQPVPVKVQFVLTLYGEEISNGDKTLTHSYDPDGGGPLPAVTVLANQSIPASDTHKLRLAVIPVVTFWNPYNVPITMQSGASCQSFRLKTPAFYIQCVKKRSTGETFTSGALNLTFAAKSSSVSSGTAEGRTDLIRLNLGQTSGAVSFAPGEVKIFSMPYTSAGQLYTVTGNTNHENNIPFNNLEAASGWNATGHLTFMHSTPNAGNRNRLTPNTNLAAGECNVVWERDPALPTQTRYSISLDDGDELTFNIYAVPSSSSSIPAGERNAKFVSRANSPNGAAFCFYMIERDIAISDYSYLNLRNYNLVSRFGASTDVEAFNHDLIRRGIPEGEGSYPIETIDAAEVINAGGAGSGATVPLMQFAMMAGSEVSESIGDFAGRKFPMRPFLHSSVLSSTFIDDNSATGPYNHGWNWWFEDIGSILGALVNNTETGNGYFGGGYTPEAGVNRVIQQEIPVVPPMSIAALSHARLGGFTLANEAPAAHGMTGGGQLETYGGSAPGGLDNPSPTLGFQRVHANGQGGLFPHTLQAIGNSYAHPHLAPNRAYNDDWQRTYDADDGVRKVTFADHSYLANKALWDEYFFSSITPQPDTIPIFGGTNRTALEVAQNFFFADPAQPLPNRRFIPYINNFDSDKLDDLFTQSSAFQDGLADKIAAHLMIEGGFNVNSTSVSAWKVLLSSLKGKPVAYLNGGSAPQEASTTGTPVGGLTLPTSAPTTSINDSKSPAEQWQGWRELSDDEVDELANAIVKQVKRRGPFLSLSEFINRRLDGTNQELSLKGALQAALDDSEVSINGSFWNDEDRKLDAEVDGLGFAFAEAAKGPVAYGSTAYIDQADILRHIGSQLTARGDTFVIRSYGDALDAKGNVVARAWCEAIVQRVPDYVDIDDENHLKSSSLVSQANQQFGRQFVISGFRWLNKDEI